MAMDIAMRDAAPSSPELLSELYSHRGADRTASGSDDVGSSSSSSTYDSVVDGDRPAPGSRSPWRLPSLLPARKGPDAHTLTPIYTDSAGIEWGPYRLSPDRFQLNYYPPTIPTLSHLYRPDGTVSMEFIPYPAGKQFPWSPIVYRPEPEVLQNLHSLIVGHLRKVGWSARSIVPDQKLFREGMWLWPPLERYRNSLQMPSRMLEGKLLRIPGTRLRRAIKTHKNLFMLKIQTAEGIRHVLATTTNKAHIFTPVYTGREGNSKLWLFYERRWNAFTASSGRSGTAFLGAMFLPKGTESLLLDSGDMKVLLPG
ncbi:hypothetical protein PHSY_001998 [Pseudozyma hubeiensis SY62]|uniref:Uncharacterized protein n=1 Tax=Pseudozyma hubeiensis (strain SY62) TaxID=1305764 RepID=R9P095_PSEHS|nr:hypothetical protein PHSY_001998 [Pseudozyma hubeiensis SY62]GAC94427.1 hypothetical protein PHSY_001998 [Pseudozyma hubeiensis SY62]